MLKKIKSTLRWKLYNGLYKPGSYHSTIPSKKEVAKESDRIFNWAPPLGIDLQTENQLKRITTFAQYDKEFNWPGSKSPGRRYYTDNSFFNETDAFSLYALIKEFHPKRIIEVGSGFSSAIMLDINELFIKTPIHFSFVEPHPERLKSLLTESDYLNKNIDIIENNVQDVPISFFQELEANDVLFIDSSHVSKIGSDVNYLFFSILPALRKGTLIHIHDICYPFEYLKDWIDLGIYWNEAYLLKAFLMYNTAFEVLLFNNQWSKNHFPDLSHYHFGGSFWMRKL